MNVESQKLFRWQLDSVKMLSVQFLKGITLDGAETEPGTGNKWVV